MFADDLFFEFKGSMMTELIGRFDPAMPSHREAVIQVAKLKRMARSFRKKFPGELVQTGAKLGKLRGKVRHRLNQQNERVDGLYRQLIEELVVNEFSKAPGMRITKNKIRGIVRTFVENFNHKIHGSLQQRLDSGYAAAAAVLGGQVPKGLYGIKRSQTAHKPSK